MPFARFLLSALLWGQKRIQADAHPTLGHAVRALFAFDSNTTALSLEAAGAIPHDVSEAHAKYMEKMEALVNQPGKRWDQCVGEAREALAYYIKAPSADDLLLADYGSPAMDALLRSWEDRLGPGDIVLDLSSKQQPFDTFYQRLGAKDNVTVLSVPMMYPVYGSECYTKSVGALLGEHGPSGKIKLAVISHVSSHPGVVLPVKELVALLHKHNVPVAVDGTHALGAVHVDLHDMGMDFYVADMHRWMFAPKASTFAYVRKDHHASIKTEDIATGPLMNRFRWDDSAELARYCAVVDALAFREKLGGDVAVQPYMHSIAKWAGHFLTDLWGTQQMAPDEMQGNVASVQAPTDDAASCAMLVRRLADEHGISISAGTVQNSHGDIACYLRLATQIYMDESDVRKVGELVPQFLMEEGSYHYPPRGLPLYKVQTRLLQHPFMQALAVDI